MWASLRLVMFLTIFETVFDHVKCRGKITKKTFVPVTTTTKPAVTHTHTHSLIQWVPINDTQEENNTIEAVVDTTIASVAPSQYHSENKTNLRTEEQKIIRTWEPAEPEELTDKPNTTTTSTTRTTSEYLKTDECKFFKDPEIPFDTNRMADIWQTVYYQLPDKVQCFKIYIKKISDDERKTYREKYSTFDGKVNWDHISLEIKAVTNIARKHFLQSSNEHKGVLSNIIIAEENNNRVLREESSDQWLVVQKLLLLRDCDSGGVVVFAKVPHTPLQQDVGDALKQFGEEYGNGSPACPDDETVNRYYESEEEGLESISD